MSCPCHASQRVEMVVASIYYPCSQKLMRENLSMKLAMVERAKAESQANSSMDKFPWDTEDKSMDSLAESLHSQLLDA